jgi:hypothetical protein
MKEAYYGDIKSILLTKDTFVGATEGQWHRMN